MSKIYDYERNVSVNSSCVQQRKFANTPPPGKCQMPSPGGGGAGRSWN